MSVTFNPNGGIDIDDPELEQKIADLCQLTGETVEVVLLNALRERREELKRAKRPAL